MNKLERFVEAQDPVFADVIQELKAGYKHTHWMWFIFPQIKGLGLSTMSVYYAIGSLKEAIEYLGHPILGQHLIECCQILLTLNRKSAVEIFGSTDAMKLKSSMTLFTLASKDENSIFDQVLQKYYEGKKDENTIDLIESH